MVRPRGGSNASASVSVVSALVLFVIGVSVGVSGCTIEPEEGSAGPEETAVGGSALTAVDSLTVKGRAPKTGYTREKFGTAWADTDSNQCDTRVISMLRAVMGPFSQRMQGVIGYA